MLVEAGSDIEATNLGCPPTLTAAINLRCEALLSLLKQGATVNAQNNALDTALMYAAYSAGKQGAAEIVDALLRAGADETIVNFFGDNAADGIRADVEGDENYLAGNVDRVRELLANAPADRAWRRRGYLVLCRSYPDKVVQKNHR